MYIVKASHKGNVFLRSSSGYVEVETENRAIEIYTKMINEYPNSVDVQVFKSEKIEIPSHILEEALKHKEEEYKMKLFMIENGLDKYEIIDLEAGKSKEYWIMD